jgi:hypothetical protein
VGIHQHELGLADVGLDAEQRSTHLCRLQIAKNFVAKLDKTIAVNNFRCSNVFGEV